MSEYSELVKEVGGRLVDKAVTFVTEDAWNLISDEGKAQVVQVGMLWAECEIASMLGRDVSVPMAALKAALGNFELAGKIRVAAHTDEFVDELKDGLLMAAKIIFSTAVAAIL